MGGFICAEANKNVSLHALILGWNATKSLTFLTRWNVLSIGVK